MCNEKEGDPWVIDITLMYAQDTAYQSNLFGKVGVATVSSKGVVKKNEGVGARGKEKNNEKSLRELLEEQDIGMHSIIV